MGEGVTLGSGIYDTTLRTYYDMFLQSDQEKESCYFVLKMSKNGGPDIPFFVTRPDNVKRLDKTFDEIC